MAHQKHLFINLPSKDVDASLRFATAIGLTKKHVYGGSKNSNKSISVSYGESVEIFYHSHETFSSWLFPGRKVSDPFTTTQALLSLSAESKEDVDRMIAAGVEAGGKQGPNMVPDEGGCGIYSRSVEDLDGHVYEIVYFGGMKGQHSEGCEKKSEE